MTAARAYYHCDACHQGHCPFDQANGLQADRLSTGLRPLVCLAGVLESFRAGADDLLRRFSGVRLSAATTRRATQQAGAALSQRQRQGAIVTPAATPAWDFRVAGHDRRVAYLGLDAFSVPMQQPGGGKTEGRMLYTAILYTPDKSRHHYLVDFDLDRLAGQMRQAAIALGLGEASQVIAITDAGNGIEAALRRHFWDDLLCILDWYHAAQHLHAYASSLYAADAGNGIEEALRRHFWDDLLCILDWYHASQHLHTYAKCLHPGDEGQAQAWAQQAKGILYEQGGAALRAHLRAQEAPAEAATADELRKLTHYFTAHAHRTDYPEYRRHGWDIGSGPTEAACKVVGARLKGS